MSALCQWLHEQLDELPLVAFPFNLNTLPPNGIYFFYEQNELLAHSPFNQRIVRIGTHRNGNFRSRISQHFLLDNRKMHFNENGAAPKDRSIFRKNIGRALLNQQHNPYLPIWDIDFTTLKARAKSSHLRNISYEAELEIKITSLLRKDFKFRYIIVEDDTKRIGSQGLENALIGTVAGCDLCKPSTGWLGNNSPVHAIVSSGLWQTQHVTHSPLSESDRKTVEAGIAETKLWIQTKTR